MSGGFFRGTSADQDTRFSNKQAKLLKSQKFAPELEHLVDMTKVKMDVIRPWIATRATELLGFEDEVLINFVYGLLDGKVVDGKKIQIQLTGFMEKNTGKFMKELWTLLLSAQNNVSGVPQQFLDAKEEEQRKKKEENDRITQEIQKRKERAGRELEREKPARMDDEDSDPKSRKAGHDSLSKPRASSDQPEEERKEDGSHTRKTRNGNSTSPYGNIHSPLSQRSSPSAARSNSREGHKSRSSSIYSQPPRHSISPKRRYHSPIRQSLSPIRQCRSPHRRPISRSPIRRRSHSRRRSISRSRNRSPSPYWRRSHARRRSPYPYRRSPTSLHRMSPSPVRRRSPPLRRRSPSPMHRRSLSPARRRSPIHVRRRSPFSYRHRSPVRRGLPSPARDESLSPIRRRSPLSSSFKYRKQSPPRSPVSRHADLNISPRQRNRSLSPHGSQSPLNRRTLNKEHSNLVDRDISGQPSDKRTQRRLPAQYDMEREPAKYDGSDKSPSHSKFQAGKRISSRKYSRSPSSSRSPVVRRGEIPSRHDSSDTNLEEERTTSGRDVAQHKNGPSSKQKKDSHPDMDLKKPYANDNSPEVFSPDRSAVQSPTTHRLLKSDIKHDMGDRLKRKAQINLQSAEEIEYGPGGAIGGKNRLDDIKLYSRDKSSEGRKTKEHALRSSVGHNAISNVHPILEDIEYEETLHERELGQKSKRKFDIDIQLNSNYLDSEEAQDIDKQHHKRSDSKQNISDSSETESQADDKKETKRRRKEEKRLRKEEKRRRHDDRRQKRQERRAAKQKTRSKDASSPSSSFEKHRREAYESDGDKYLKNSYKSTAEEAESEQKRLEIELRKKALESLRAKKSIND